ncbi:unnamed protein product [Lymnaea stagnalis]|uniref:THD domain-containing protein n=1 Tax=Lymnaea stagnalis TaxID=6523 RepID=A0AAV2HBB6_LYMST
MADETFTDESEWVPTSHRAISKQSSRRRPSSIGSVDSGYSIRSGSAYYARPPIVHRRAPPPLPLSITGRTPPTRPPPPPPRRRQCSTSQPNHPTSNSHRHRTRTNQDCPSLIIRRRYLVIICCVSLTLSTMCIIMFGLMWIRSSRDPLEVCVDCSGLNVSTIGTDVLTKRYDGQCCAHTKDQFSTLIGLVLERITQNLNCISLSPSMAHLTFKKSSSSTLEFDANLTRSVGDSMEIDTTQPRLMIKTPGLYFIYSSIYFKSNQTCKVGEESQMCEQNVFKGSSERLKVSLLRSVHKCCSQGQFTSYAGGLFSLAAGDIIFVSVTDTSLIDFDPAASYLGLMMVRS